MAAMRRWWRRLWESPSAWAERMVEAEEEQGPRRK